MNTVREFVRAMQRPFAVYTGWSVLMFLTVRGMLDPAYVVSLSALLTGYLFGERAKHGNGPPGGIQ